MHAGLNHMLVLVQGGEEVTKQLQFCKLTSLHIGVPDGFSAGPLAVAGPHPTPSPIATAILPWPCQVLTTPPLNRTKQAGIRQVQLDDSSGFRSSKSYRPGAVGAKSFPPACM